MKLSTETGLISALLPKAEYSKLERIRHRINDQLEVCVTQSEGTFQQVSFVNKFATIEGGTHVDYVSDQIAACMVKICSEDFQVEECEVKRHLWLFVNAVIDNPTFDSPTRDALISPQARRALVQAVSLLLSFLTTFMSASLANYLPVMDRQKLRRLREKKGLSPRRKLLRKRGLSAGRRLQS